MHEAAIVIADTHRRDKLIRKTPQRVELAPVDWPTRATVVTGVELLDGGREWGEEEG